MPEESHSNQSRLDFGLGGLGAKAARSIMKQTQDYAYDLSPLNRYRVEFSDSMKEVWKDVNIAEATNLKEVAEMRMRVKESLAERFAEFAGLSAPEATDELTRVYGIDWNVDEVEQAIEELKDTFGEYLDTRWMKDFELGARAGLHLPVDRQELWYEKLNKQMSARTTSYSGVLWAVAGALALLGASKTGRRVQWNTAGSTACVDCLDLEAGGPYEPGALRRFPGDGSTECHGNCRCQIELVD